MFPGTLEYEYSVTFRCSIDPDETMTYKFIYTDLRAYGADNTQNPDLIVEYDASNLKGNLDDLMQKSLDTGVDLIFEQVKDKKIDTKELDKIREKAWKEGWAILY